MTIPKLLAAASWLAIAGSIGCADEDSGSGNGSGGAGGLGTGGGAPLVCNTDYGQIVADPAPVSLRTDIMPIFGQSCVQSQCHDAQLPKANLFLGPVCQFNMTTGGCDFTMPPLTDADVQSVWMNLVGVESTTAAGVLRVAATDPARSFVVHKVSNTHALQGFTCEPQDPMVTGCGEPMPPGGSTLCTQRNGQERFNRIVRWIQQGALNN
jgi:hypothetical protein